MRVRVLHCCADLAIAAISARSGATAACKQRRARINRRQHIAATRRGADRSFHVASARCRPAHPFIAYAALRLRGGMQKSITAALRRAAGCRSRCGPTPAWRGFGTAPRRLPADVPSLKQFLSAAPARLDGEPTVHEPLPVPADVDDTPASALGVPHVTGVMDSSVGSGSGAAQVVSGAASTLTTTSTFYLETYGCQMNEADSEVVTALLQVRPCMPPRAWVHSPPPRPTLTASHCSHRP
jgi:hypothetical protein